MPYGLGPSEKYALLPIQHLDKWEKLTNKDIVNFSLDVFNEMYDEVWKWNTLHLNETNYKLTIRHGKGGLFTVKGVCVGM